MEIICLTYLFGFLAIFAVSLASFIGAVTLASSGKRLPQLYSILTAFATGVLIATVFYHLLPKAVEIYDGFSPDLSTIILLGLLIPFILEKTVHWHHHHSLVHDEYIKQYEASTSKENDQIKPFVFVNLLGDGLHNFIDGALLIGTFTVSTSLGVATFLGMIIHELAQELGDFSILIEGGLETKKALLWNFGTALTAFLGGLLALLFNVEIIEKVVIPLAVGNFLYLAIADLIPEMHQKTARKDWITQIGVGMIGVLIMYLLTLI